MADGRVLFITVGTTALSAERVGERMSGEADSPAAVREAAQRYLDDPETITECEERELFGRLLRAHRAFWSELRAAQFFPAKEGLRETSAEMTSTYVLTHTTEEIERFHSKRDRFVLLASDTKEGKLAARINSRLLHEFVFDPPCRCAAAEDAPAGCEKAPVEVVEGLEAGAFNADVSSNVSAILDKDWGGRLPMCNITGGYKGTIPAIAAWANRRAAVDARGAPIYYQHVRSDRPTCIEFLGGKARDRSLEVPCPPSIEGMR